MSFTLVAVFTYGHRSAGSTTEDRTMNSLTGKTAMIVGASRGLGRGIAEAFYTSGASVIAIGRDATTLQELAASNPAMQPEAVDATDPATAGRLLGRYVPNILALVAGAAPHLAPLHEQTWETFSINWQADVHMAFNWLKQALLLPLRPGSRVIVMSSGAALQGSPLSGGYAGAKATQRFLAGYADQESQRAVLGIRIVAVLPRLTPATSLGQPAVAAYAARAGISEAEFVQQMGKPVTPASAGEAFIELATGDPSELGAAYALSGGGLQPLP
jgi:NAD(P)-dependent dehydrogenase (short-subunit alcohol dehydrogenase family)